MHIFDGHRSRVEDQPTLSWCPRYPQHASSERDKYGFQEFTSIEDHIWIIAYTYTAYSDLHATLLPSKTYCPGVTYNQFLFPEIQWKEGFFYYRKGIVSDEKHAMDGIYGYLNNCIVFQVFPQQPHPYKVHYFDNTWRARSTSRVLDIHTIKNESFPHVACQFILFPFFQTKLNTYSLPNRRYIKRIEEVVYMNINQTRFLSFGISINSKTDYLDSIVICKLHEQTCISSISEFLKMSNIVLRFNRTEESNNINYCQFALTNGSMRGMIKRNVEGKNMSTSSLVIPIISIYIHPFSTMDCSVDLRIDVQVTNYTLGGWNITGLTTTNNHILKLVAMPLSKKIRIS